MTIFSEPRHNASKYQTEEISQQKGKESKDRRSCACKSIKSIKKESDEIIDRVTHRANKALINEQLKQPIEHSAKLMIK